MLNRYRCDQMKMIDTLVSVMKVPACNISSDTDDSENFNDVGWSHRIHYYEIIMMVTIYIVTTMYCTVLYCTVDTTVFFPFDYVMNN
jgi:hypothetical protein